MTRRVRDPGDHGAAKPPHGAPVTLAAYTPAHEPALAALLGDNDVRNSLYAGLASVAESETLMTDWINLSGDAAMHWVVTNHQQTIVGAVRIDSGDLAYFIGRPFWGQGFGRAAVQMAVALIDTEIAVRAVIDRNNRASLRIVEAAGFRFAGSADRLGHRPGSLLYVRRAA